MLLADIGAGFVLTGVGWLSSGNDPLQRGGLGIGPWLSLRLFYWPVYQFYDQFGIAITAVCATSMIARQPRDPEPDARDWAGRLFASLAVALAIAESLLRAMGR
jgi:hypothetical protein